jgi:hypothetical protein
MIVWRGISDCLVHWLYQLDYDRLFRGSVFVVFCWRQCFVFFSALEKIIINGYKALNLVYFFTVGKDEVKAWTLHVSRHLFFTVGKDEVKAWTLHVSRHLFFTVGKDEVKAWTLHVSRHLFFTVGIELFWISECYLIKKVNILMKHITIFA